MTASLTFDWVNGGPFTPGGSVELQILDAPGATPLFTGAQTASSNGGVSFDFSLHGVDLTPGKDFVVTDAASGLVKTHTLLNVTFDSLDRASDVGAGTAPAGAEVHVFVVGGGAHLGSLSTTADGAGAWTVDFTGTVDIQLGVGRARQRLCDTIGRRGHRSVVELALRGASRCLRSTGWWGCAACQHDRCGRMSSKNE